MANPCTRRLFLIGATALAASVPALADDAPQKAPEVSTVAIGPAGLTTAELAKLAAVTKQAEAATAPATDATPPADQPIVPHTPLPKPTEITTIVVGPFGLTSQELAKITALAPPTAPAPPTTPTSKNVEK
jgi:hypothetical protein